MSDDLEIEKMLGQNFCDDSMLGYYTDDMLVEDRMIPNDYHGECINFSLAGKGFGLLRDHETDPIDQLIKDYESQKNIFLGDAKKLEQLELEFLAEYQRLAFLGD